MSQKTNNQLSRRHFLGKIGYGGAGLIIMGSYGFTLRYDPGDKTYKAIVVDFRKCSGCRTCEAVCSAFHNREIIAGTSLCGPGNPHLANIKVHHFNPDIDIPSACALCTDAPCIEACPVEEDPMTGYKALYRDGEKGIIINDKERCIGCQSCYEACKSQRAGVIRPNPETGKPEGICDLCNGEPQCVANCPFDALQYIELADSNELKGMAPKEIAGKMIRELYNLKLEEI